MSSALTRVRSTCRAVAIFVQPADLTHQEEVTSWRPKTAASGRLQDGTPRFRPEGQLVGELF